MISSIFAWFKALPVAGRVLVALAPLILVALIYGAGYHSGWNAKAAKVAKAEAQDLQKQIDTVVTSLKNASQGFAEYLLLEEEIRNVRESFEFDPAGDRFSDDERLRFISRIKARRSAGSPSDSVPSAVPGTPLPPEE